MESTEGKSGSSSTATNDKECVKVAVNVRPLINAELLVGCTDCITIAPGEPQVHIGSHSFTFDHVYGSTGSPCSEVFDDCVAPLVDALFHGYNATVLAYGQTGSGKTYTMGTNYTGDANSVGIIPNVMESIFSRIDEMKNSAEILIRVSFIEIFKEEVFDLLEGASGAKQAAPSRAPIQIRETANGGITLAGVTEPEVRTKEEMASYLSRGSLCRATGSTNMNSQSSRSHAIFTITMEQKKSSRGHSTLGEIDEVGDEILCAKLHLVDLAGSERAKRTGADGLRLKEGIHINRGLLALGNVISALGDEKKRKEGGHVPYRDSKLTRLLQDSLGGNSKTVMIACVSPADSNAEETLNTLKYANRARNIQNKAVINRDPMTAQMQKMRNQLEQLQAELLYFRGEGGTPFEELQILKHKISLLEASNAELHRGLQESQITCEHLANRALDAQVEKDKLLLKIEAARKGKSWDDVDVGDENEDCGLVKNYVSKIQELEAQLLRLQSLSDTRRNDFADCLDLEDETLHPRNAYTSTLNGFPSVKEGESPGEVDVLEKELEHSSLQDKLDRELQELDKCLEQKEAEMKRFATPETSVLKHHYEKKVHELELEKKALMKEIDDLRFNLQNMSSASDDGAQKLKQEYLQKLTSLESQVSELKKKQDAQSQILRQKQKSDEAARRLQEEIHRIKTQKVQLQQKIKQESEQFRQWKASREKEVLQLKKEGRRNEYEMHKLLALNQRQKMVLQRKTEEASMATRRLKELLEARKASSRNGNGPGIQALMQAIEHELEVVIRVHDVRAEYERQMKARSDMANEVKILKEEAAKLKQKTMSDCPQSMSPGARNSRIFALENMLSTSSATLVSMASQLSEAEERERLFNGKGRWNQVRSLPEAKNVMNHLFNLASSSRCQLRDIEVDCREKDSEIAELKEKIMRLSSLVRQRESQNAELVHREQMRKLISKQRKIDKANKIGAHGEANGTEFGSHVYDFRKGPRASMVFNFPGTNFESLDMDISDSDIESEIADDDMDEEWVPSELLLKKRRSRTKANATVDLLHQPELVDVKSEPITEEIIYNDPKPAPGVCCTCSRASACKTLKCECRASGGSCGGSCGCVSNKCSNREGGSNQTDASEGGEMDLVSQGTMLLQSALADKPTEELPRKPLSDIGNTKSNAPRPNQRKKWKKSVIQLVPVQPIMTESENKADESVKAEKENTSVENDVPLKLPRAMRSTLKDKNSDHGEEVVGKRVEGSTSEKENRGY
ncbi:Kinesin-like protein KIN-4C [Ranunculus cassubicifolius]